MKRIIIMLSGLIMLSSFVNAEGVICYETYEPVCAVKNGIIKTYSNDCFAKSTNAKILHNGVCTGLEKYDVVKSLNYITGKTKKLVDNTIENYFKKLSSKTIPEQLNILQKKLEKVKEVREKLQKMGKLNGLIGELLFYLEFKFEEKVSDLKS